MSRRIELVKVVVTEKPKECGFCPWFRFRHDKWYADWCDMMKREFGGETPLPDWCPLEEA